MRQAMKKKWQVRSVGQGVVSRKRAPRKSFTLTVSEQELEQLVAGISDLRGKALALFLRDTGLRVGEVVALDRNVIKALIEVQGGIAAVGTLQIGKAGDRKFYVSSRAFEALNLYLDSRVDTSPALFAQGNGVRMHTEQVRRLIQGACDRLGIKRFPLHEFRRRLAWRLLVGGSSAVTTLRTLGYSTKNLTTRTWRDLQFEIPPLDLQVN
jgi:integrase